jgi:hypothetical protein
MSPEKARRRQRFEQQNDGLIAARQALYEREQVLDAMAALDRQLRQRRAELSLLVTQERYEKADVQALEGLAPQALLALLLGERDEKVAREQREYLLAQAKVAECRLAIAALEAQHQEWEARLEALAHADEEYDQQVQARDAFLAARGIAASARFAALLELLAAQEAERKELEEAVAAGRRVAELIQPHRFSAPPELTFPAADRQALRGALAQFQQELADLSQQFWPAPQLNLDEFEREVLDFEFTGMVVDFITGIIRVPGTGILSSALVLAHWLRAADKPAKWRSYWESLLRRVEGRLELVEDKLAATEMTIKALEQEKDELATRLWSAGTFS